AAEEGLRLEGPCRVTITPSDTVAPGSLVCHVEVVPGPTTPWARLITEGESLEIGHNNALIGRSDVADVVVPHDDVSRRHAIISRRAGRYWIRDVGSANGTTVDGRPVGPEPVAFGEGSMIGLGSHHYRFVV